MGYEARNIITIYGLEDEKAMSILKEIDQLAYPRESSLYDNQLDMVSKSFNLEIIRDYALKYPTAIFEVKAYGEDDGDIWKTRYRGRQKEEIIFTELPEFTEIILPEEFPNTLDAMNKAMAVLQQGFRSVAKAYVAHLVDEITCYGKKGETVNIEPLNEQAPQLRIEVYRKQTRENELLLVNSISHDGTITSSDGDTTELDDLGSIQVNNIITLLTNIIKDLDKCALECEYVHEYEQCFIIPKPNY